MKQCPYCKAQISDDALKCKYCGEWVMQKQESEVASDPITLVKNALAEKYEILAEIGRGGMAVVFKAIQKSLNRPVALKVLPQQFTHDQEFLERFHREAKAAAQLNHPNIVTIYNEGVENGVHYMAMEYIDGPDLRSIIQSEGALSIKRIKEWLIPIAEGLGYAHEKGLIHRDIKSANILIDAKGRSVLTDFGIARAAESSHLTQTGTILGTPEYMSPEQAKGEAVDARSDIYSLGVVLYECLTGRLPFQSDTILGTIHKITHEAPTPPHGIRKDIPVEMENVVLRCLAKDAAERYQTCKELTTALEQGEAKRTLFKLSEVRSGGRENIPSTAAAPLWIKTAIGVVSIALIIVLGALLRQSGIFATSSKDTGTLCDMKDASWERLSDLEKKRIETLLKEADDLFASDQLVEPKGHNAYTLYRKVLGIHPQNKYALGQMELIRKDFLKRGNINLNTGDYKGALRIAQTGLKYFKGDGGLLALQNRSKIKILEAKARLLVQKKNYITPESSNAYIISKKILRLDVNNSVAKHVLSEIKAWFFERGRMAEGQKDWMQAVRLYGEALNYFADDRDLKQKLVLARKKLQQQEQQFKNQIKGLLAETKTLLNKGQYEKSWQKYNLVLNLSPDNSQAQQVKTQLIRKLEQTAQRAYESKNYAQAIKAYALLNRLQPSGVYAHDLAKVRAAAAEQKKWLNWIDWVWVEGGSFEMGCTGNKNACDDDEKPVHTVKIDGFYISRYEISVSKFSQFVKDINYITDAERNGFSWNWEGEWYKKNGLYWELDEKGKKRAERDFDHPVIYVSWNDAMTFCKWLSDKTGTAIRLPTEAEWEYAAKGGNKSKGYQYAGGNVLNKVAWYFENSSNQTHPMGEKLPNELGIYDMSGNVWEWCLDWYGKNYYAHSLKYNPIGPKKGDHRVVRGGSWDTDIKFIRVENRFYGKPSFSSNDLGFRVIRIR